MYKKFILGILISIISIVLVYLSVRNININDVSLALKNIQFIYVVLFIVVIIFMQWLRSYRWGVMLQPLEKMDQLSLFSVTSVGFLAIGAIPARIGELARPYLISKRSSIKMSSALGTVLVERILDGLTVLVIAITVLLLNDLPSWMLKSTILFSIFILLMFFCMAGLIWRRDTTLMIINKFLHILPGKLANKLDGLISSFADGFQVITDIKSLFYLFFLSAFIWLVDVLAIYMLFLAFGFDLPVMASFVLMIILIVGIAIPTGPGYIGNWHLACVLGLSFFGLPEAEVLSFAVVYHFLSMVIVVVLGVAFLPFNKFSISDMKEKMNQTMTD